MHSRGINLRYVGLLRACVRGLLASVSAATHGGQGDERQGWLGASSGVGDSADTTKQGVSDASSRWIQSLLLQEMVARILRIALEERLRLAFRLRSKARNTRMGLQQTTIDSTLASGVAASFMNVVFGASRFSHRCWAQVKVAL